MCHKSNKSFDHVIEHLEHLEHSFESRKMTIRIEIHEISKFYISTRNLGDPIQSRLIHQIGQSLFELYFEASKF